MNDIQILKALLKPEAQVPLQDGIYRNKMAILEEPGKYKIGISNIPSDSEVIIIKVDTFPPPIGLFNGTKQECKRADYAIIYCNAEESEKIVCLIELKAKSTTSKEHEIIAQLKGGSCVISYIQSIGEVFWENKNFLSSYDYRYVSIRNISIKKPTFMKNSMDMDNNYPENMLKIGSPNNLYFCQLIGKK